MNEIDNSLKTILRGTKIVFIGIMLSKLLGYAYRVIAARVGTQEYGLISIGIAILGLLTTFSLLGLGDGVLRYISFYRGKKDYSKIKEILSSSLKITVPLSFVLAVLLFIFSNQISTVLFHNPNLNIIIKIMALAIPFNTLREVLFKTIRSFQRVEYEVYSKHIAENLTKVIFSVVFLILGYKFIGLAIAYVFAVFLSFLLAVYYLKIKVFPIKATELILPPINKELLFYSFPLLFSSLVFSVILWTDTLMLGYFTTASETGIYNAALPTSALIFIIPSTLLSLFIPVLTELYAQNKNEAFESIYKTVTKWIFLSNITLLGIFYLYSKPILEILFGSQYLSASTSLIILSTGLFLGYTMSSSQDVLLIYKKTKLIFFNTLIMVIINLSLNFYLIPIYGIIGAALATSFAFITRSILLLAETKIITNINPINIKYLKIIFSISVAIILVNYINNLIFSETNIYALIIGSFLLTIIYLLLLIITKSFEKEDMIILKIIKEKIGLYFGKQDS